MTVDSVEELIVDVFQLNFKDNFEACDLLDNDCGMAVPATCTCYRNRIITFNIESTGEPDFYDFDWDDDGLFDDGTVAVSGNRYTHTYTALFDNIVPRVRARRDATTAERDLRETLNIEPPPPSLQ